MTQLQQKQLQRLQNLKPILTAPNNGNVTAKPQDSAKADKITVTYKDEDGTNVTVVGNKGNDGTWTVVNNPGVTIDSNTGEITIPADKVRDNTVVTAITKMEIVLIQTQQQKQQEHQNLKHQQ